MRVAVNAGKSSDIESRQWITEGKPGLGGPIALSCLAAIVLKVRAEINGEQTGPSFDG